MIFTIQGVTYDSTAMEVLDTGNAKEPQIFIDQDCHVFSLTRGPHGDRVQQLRTPEIHDRFDKYALQPLKRALRD